MKSYIVRIYREEKDNPQNFIGVVEGIEKPDKRAFTNLEELWAILNPAVRERGEKRRSRGERQQTSASSNGIKQ